MIPVRFADYAFPRDKVTQFNDNFRTVKSAVKEVIGASGGVGQFGTGHAPTGKGKVMLSMWLKELRSTDEMATELDRLNTLVSKNVQMLVRETYDGRQQFCRARLLDLPEDHVYRKKPQLRQEVKLTFEVLDPRWLEVGTYAIWGLVKWGEFVWGGSPVTGAYTFPSTDFTITYNGNTPVELETIIETSAAQVCSEPMVERLVNGVVVERVFYGGVLWNSCKLEIQPRKKRVLFNGARAFGLATPYTADWLTLEPGVNHLRVHSSGGSDAATIKFHHFEAYR